MEPKGSIDFQSAYSINDLHDRIKVMLTNEFSTWSVGYVSFPKKLYI